jgi:hypothetical protein
MRGLGALFCALLGACLVTDQVQLEPEITTPPIVLTAPNQPVGSIFKFNASVQNELPIPVQIRDEDTLETLTPRWRVKYSATKWSNFDCPEIPIPPAPGVVIRQHTIRVESFKLARGACNKVEFVVSSAFISCDAHPELFDVAIDAKNDLGRAMFWVWETSGGGSDTAAQMLLNTCEVIDATATPPTMEAP